MPAKLTVSVTAEHIAKGKPASESNCPIALAFRDLGYHLKIGNGLVRLACNGHTTRRNLPRVARQFIQLFDCEVPGARIVHPFTFQINPFT